jgi:hypothetical protein
MGIAKLLKIKSGTRDSNPRLRPWQFVHQLNLKTNSVSGRFVSIRFDAVVHGQNLTPAANGVKMG